MPVPSAIIFEIPGQISATGNGVTYQRTEGYKVFREERSIEWARIVDIELFANFDAPYITSHVSFSEPSAKCGVYKGIVPDQLHFASNSEAESAYRNLLSAWNAH